MSCISVQNLSLSFGEKTLFDNVSFDVYEKDKIGFVGANGVGKTSLFKILTGEYQPTSGAAFLGKNVKLGYMEQHTCSENKTVYEELISVFDDLIKLEKELDAIASRLTAEPLPELIAKQDMLNEQFTGSGGLTYKSLTRSCLIGMGFSESDFDKPTSKLSGGQRSKLILSKLLLSKCDLLLLDEPTNHLDIKSVEWLEGFLSSFSGAFIVISHDRYFLDRVTDKTIEIENKKMRSYKGNYSEFLVKKQAEQKAIAEKYENDIFFFDGGSLYINLYIPSRLETDGISLEIDTDYPYSDKISITIKGNTEIDRLKLRIPEFAHKTAHLRHGTEEFYGIEKGYFTVHAIKVGDSVELTLPMRVTEYKSREKNVCALKYGPVTLCAPLGKITDRVSEYISNELLIDDATVEYPSLLLNGKSAEACVEAVDRERLIFRIPPEYSSLGAPIMLKPFFEVKHEFYTVYFDKKL